MRAGCFASLVLEVCAARSRCCGGCWQCPVAGAGQGATWRLTVQCQLLLAVLALFGVRKATGPLARADPGVILRYLCGSPAQSYPVPLPGVARGLGARL